MEARAAEVMVEVTVEVPHGRAAGSSLVVQTEGRAITVVIPPGKVPGDSFLVSVPVAALPAPIPPEAQQRAKRATKTSGGAFACCASPRS